MTNQQEEQRFTETAMHALTALLGLMKGKGEEDAAKMMASLEKANNGDAHELTSILQQSGLEGRAVIEKMSQALDAATAVVQEDANSELDTVVSVIEEQLPAQIQEERVPTEIKPEIEDLPPDYKYSPPVVSVADALKNLTRGDSRPTADFGAPKPSESGAHFSSFELTQLRGSLLDSGELGVDINKYLDLAAKKKGKKNAMDLSEAEYQEILTDQESFHKWAAKEWVDRLIEDKKEEARKIADEFVDPLLYSAHSGRRGVEERIDRGIASEPFAQSSHYGRALPFERFFGGILKDNKAYKFACQDIDKYRKNSETEIAETIKKDQAELDLQKKGMKELGLSDAVVAEACKKIKEEKASALAKKKAEVKELLAEMQKELDKRKSELAVKVGQKENEVKSGVKREAVLSAHRWGETLKKIAKQNPDAVTRQEKTGEIYLLVNNLSEEDYQIIFDRFDKEIDAMMTSGDAGDLRQKNLDALVGSDEELNLAVKYLKHITQNVKYHHGRRGGYDLDQKNKVKFVHDSLIGKKGDLIKDLANWGDRKDGTYNWQDTTTGIEEMIDFEVNASSRLGIKFDTSALDLLVTRMEAQANKKEQVEITGNSFNAFKGVLSHYLNESSPDPVLGRKIENFLEVVPRDGNGGFLYNLDNALTNAENKLKENKGDTSHILRIKAKLYGAATRAGELVSVVNGHYRLPGSLTDDLMKRYISNWDEKENVSNAAFDQVRLQLLEWTRRYGYEGRTKALKAIDDLVQRVNYRISHAFSLGYSYDPKATEKALAAVQYAHNQEKPFFEKLEKLRAEIEGK